MFALLLCWTQLAAVLLVFLPSFYYHLFFELFT